MNIKYFLCFLTFAYNINIIFSQSDLTSYTNTNIHNLKTSIFENYTFDTLPINNSVPLNVSMSLAIRAFSNIDQKEGNVELNVWLRYFWNDYNLKWNKDRWNISSLVVNTDPSLENNIWTPDIYLYNTAEIPLENLKLSNALVYSNGDILWSRPGMIKSTCRFDLTNFPYDRQKCKLKLGSWSYTGNHLILNKAEQPIDLDNYQLNEEWELENTRTQVNKLKYNCCPDEYYDITFYFDLKRHSGYYETNIIIPTFATASLILITLLIPWDSGERISFTVTVMLSIIVFLLLLSDILPKSNQNPLLSRMITSLTFFSLLGVFFTVLISALNEYNKGLKNQTEIKNRFMNKLFHCCKYITCSQYNCKTPAEADNEVAKTNQFDLAIESLQNLRPDEKPDIPRSKSYSLATTNNIKMDIDTGKIVNEVRLRKLEKKIVNNDEETLSPLQEQCKTLINIVERLYSFAFMVAFLSLCIVMFVARYK